MRQQIFLYFVLNLCFNLAEYFGNPDESNNIERPCAVYDIRCIRKFFANHGKCSIATGPAPDPYIRPQTSYYVSRSNTSVLLINGMVSGLNGRIEEFFVNRDTNNVVLAVDFRLDLAINDTYFIVHRRGREPIVTLAPLRIIYQSAVITAIIPNINNLQLDQFEAFGFVNDVLPFFFIGPEKFATTDPGASGTLVRQEDNIQTNIFEEFLTESAFYIATFIQYNICDFGLKVV